MSLFRDDTPEAQAIWANVEYVAQFVPEWVKPQVIAAAKEHVKLMKSKQGLPYKIDPQQQTCKVCGRPDKFNFHVPDAVWEWIVPEEYRNRVVCLYCFDEFAYQRFSKLYSSLCFAGKVVNFSLDKYVDT